MSNISEECYIVIGICPGITRPDDILKNILNEYINLSKDDFEITLKNFGNWTFNVHKDKEEIFKIYLNKIIDKLKDLYHKNVIRYAEWNSD